MSNTNSILKTYKKYKLLLKISNAIWNDNKVEKSICVCFNVLRKSSSFTALSHFGGSK